jgi:hypothetical protein
MGFLIVVAILYFAYRRPDKPEGKWFYAFIAPRFGIQEPEDIRNLELRAHERLDRSLDQNKDAWRRMPYAQVDDTIVTTDAENPFISGKFVRYELRFPHGGNKKNKRFNMEAGGQNHRYAGYFCQDGEVFMSLPEGENEKLIWLRLRPIEGATGFVNYLRGTDQDHGPARIFSDNDQKGVVIFNDFPGMGGASLLARDIQWSYIVTRGDTQQLADAESILDETDEAQLKEELPMFVSLVAKVVNQSPEINDVRADPSEVAGDDDEDALWVVTFDPRENGGQALALQGHVFHVRPTRRHPAADLIDVAIGTHSQEASILPLPKEEESL